MRIINRLAAVLLAFVLIAAGLFAIVQTVSGLLGRPWPVSTSGRGQLGTVPLSDQRVLWTSIVVGLVGLIALAAQLIPRRQPRLPASVGPDWWVRRRSVEQRSTAAAEFAGGVHHPRLSVVGAEGGRWRVRLTGEAPADRRSAVEESVRHELTSLGAPADVTVSATLSQPGRVR